LTVVAAPLKLSAQAVAVAVVAALAVVLVWRLTHQTPPPKVGGPAPNFSLRRLDGDGTVSLRSLRGKTVVLNFWASWCGPCKREAPTLEKVWREYRSRGLVVLGVDSEDASGDARRFLRAHGITYPVVVDASGGLAQDTYGIPGYPSTFVIDRAGRVVGPPVLGPVSDGAFSSQFTRNLQEALRS
jgi:cytochrome c biogenesis protein CcmG/thiol:disulfide interchange protein DsbE